MKNGGAVAFTLECGTDSRQRKMYRIKPDSFEIVEGGFDNKKKLKKKAKLAAKMKKRQ